GNEFVAVFNPTPKLVLFFNEAGPWRLTGDVEFAFESALAVPSQGGVVVVPFDPKDEEAVASFQARVDVDKDWPLVGPWDGRLSNRGGRVGLEKPEPPDGDDTEPSWVVVDEVIYFDREPWDERADGGGASLKRKTPEGSGNNPANWSAE
ncbi:MAG: hypothetical protein AAF492_19790, partial [Verrucomicrobiota bacterium]